MPGVPLAHLWPDLSDEQRERAVDQLAHRLKALHATSAPEGLPPIERAPQLLDLTATDPTAPVLDALRQAMELEFVDRRMLADAVDMVTELAPTLMPIELETLVHGDVTFENVLWHDGEVTALLDMEWARPGPRDLDLDIILRCAAYPELHVAEAFAARTQAVDYSEVPWWLAKAYPAMFQYPHQIDRMRVYAIAYEVRDLLASPPQAIARRLPELHAYHRLQHVVSKESYIDVLGRGRV
jgi:aminoglycoside phosphotransferase (APT) family kinase protein